MAIRKSVLSLGQFYHIYSRGVEKRTIFLDDLDKHRFQRLLFVCNSSKPVVYKTIQGLPLDKIDVGDKLVAIGAYCLMANHFHLLIREVVEGGTVKFMTKFLTAYSMYFNKKYDRVGALFGSQFKSEHLDKDEYLKYIFSYIHLNPTKSIFPNWREGMKERNKGTLLEFIKSYDYSSAKDYLGINREQKRILSSEVFPEYFVLENEWEDELISWLNYPGIE